MRDKRAKFVELANQRVNRALDQMRLIGNLANKGSYDYTEDDAKKIVRSLKTAVDNIQSRFSESKGNSEQGFSL